MVADRTVAELHGPRVRDGFAAAGLRASLFDFPAGEAHKTRESWAELTDAMLAAGLGRDAAVLALGGGVTGDLAGFVAATYMRGVPLVQLPTSLLAMIDSSVGGKTGVDTPAGKNLVGAFHPAAAGGGRHGGAAHAARRRSCARGWRRRIKHGAIADAGYLEWIEPSARADPRGWSRRASSTLILRSVEIKAAVVARDEREAGPRKTLNFGHTIGHAVEALSGFRLLHGEAVAIGMVVEARARRAPGRHRARDRRAAAPRLARRRPPHRRPRRHRRPPPSSRHPRSTRRPARAAWSTRSSSRIGEASWGHGRGGGGGRDRNVELNVG